jgi:pimeloyl-ACP methyl ester carboxylesterase
VELELSGTQHRYWVTEPVNGGLPQVNIVAKPGWSQIAEDGLVLDFHKDLTKAMPDARVLTHATEGVGPTARRVEWWELPDHSLDAMAKHELEFLTKFYGDAESLLVGTSMGSVIHHKVMRQNLAKGNAAAIMGAVDYDAAIVDTCKTFEAMGVRFFPSIAIDGLKQVAFRTNPFRMGSMLGTLIASRNTLADGPVIAKQGLDLLHGTPLEETEEVLENYPVSVIVGTKDSVGQVAMWNELAKRFPNLQLHAVEGFGHAMALNSYKAARKITASAVEIGAYHLPKAA